MSEIPELYPGNIPDLSKSHFRITAIPIMSLMVGRQIEEKEVISVLMESITAMHIY